VYSTAGIHPCSSAVFSAHHKEDVDGHTMPCDPDPTKPVSEDLVPCPENTTEIISQLASFVDTAQRQPPGLVAFGEFGLDYDRLHYCSRTLQLHSFDAQLKLAASLKPQLPLFLHSRAAHGDFVACLKAHYGEKLERLTAGAVVHSFTGTVEEMQELMHLGLYIGVNGCSFKTAENCAVVKEMHLNRIMLETDGPWCEVRPSHEGWKYLVAASRKGGGSEAPAHHEPPLRDVATAAQQPKGGSKKHPAKKESGIAERYKVFKKEKWTEGAMVKGRNEPCMIERVAVIVAGIKGVELKVVCEAAWENTVKVFGLSQEP
jgi:TatD DNase family protein